MNLREAIGEYAVRYARRQEVIGMEGEGAERIRGQFGEAQERLYRAVKVAEAAMAIVAQQEAVGYHAFADVVMGRGELWEQCRAARAKAKDDLGEALAVLRRLVVHACVDSGRDAAKSVEAFVDARALLKKHGA